MKQIFEGRKELLLIGFLLIIAGITHGINMFGFPYYENDEGAYMSQAWSLVKEGKVAPYTYWYDHAPGGWMFIALWTLASGGFFTFGPSINSGRVFMLVLHIATTFFLYYIAKKISGRYEAGILSVLVYSFSPLGIYYQRRVLLDNIMTFWVFASAAILVNKNLKLSKIILSSIMFGIAVLTKENAIFFLPFYLYLIYVNTSKSNRHFSYLGFLIPSLSIISTYFLYALLKKEFFPVGFLGDTSPHVSMLTSFKFQSSRGASLPFWRRGSDFYGSVFEWINKDSAIVIAGGAALLIASILSIKKKMFRASVIFGWLFLLFLIRGGLVIGFYVIPLIPIFALLIGQTLEFLIRKLSFKRLFVYRGGVYVGCIALVLTFINLDFGHYTRNETAPQIKAIRYVKENIPEDAYIVIDNYMYVDIKDKGYINDKVFKNADWFWKVYYDPEIKDGRYGDDFEKIEYITLSHEMLRQVGQGTQDYLKDVLKNSDEIASWKNNTTSHVDFQNYLSTNGDWMSIFKRKSLEDIYLADSWENYKKTFIRSYGQVIDPATGNTTSEGQSYAMLRAVWIGDKEMFDDVWKWTKDHLQKRGNDMLLSWLWNSSSGREMPIDSASASDADVDTALALIFAYKRWDDPRYLLEATTILRDIWDKEVVNINGNYLLTAGTNSVRDSGYLVNPSYFAPAHFRVFAKVDTTRNWNKLADDTYYFLDDIGKSGNYVLVPNWAVIDRNGTIASARKYVNESADDYGMMPFGRIGEWRSTMHGLPMVRVILT